MSVYIHQEPTWPRFQWSREKLAEQLIVVHIEQGRLLGCMEGLGFKLRQEVVLGTATVDVLKSSEIEGERLDAGQVRSSVARRLGMDIGGLKLVDRNVEGVVEMMLDATRHYEKPLTEERLFAWHASLFPTARSGMRPIRVGAWRDDRSGPMQVVSGPVGKEHVHFQAPAASRLDAEMKRFLAWFNANEERFPHLRELGSASFPASSRLAAGAWKWTCSFPGRNNLHRAARAVPLPCADPDGARGVPRMGDGDSINEAPLSSVSGFS